MSEIQQNEQPAGATPAPKEVAASVESWDDFAEAVGGLTPAEAAKAVLESKRWEQRAKSVPERQVLSELQRKAKQFEALEQASKTELERTQEQAQALQRQLETTQREADIASVALEVGLTPAQARRLIGTTREELLADAEQIKQDFPASPTTNEPRAPRIDRSQGSSATGAATNDPAQQFASIIRGQLGS